MRRPRGQETLAFADMWTLTETTIEVTIDPGPEEGPIAGSVRSDEAEPRHFTGYVGLMAAIDAVLAEARERQG